MYYTLEFTVQLSGIRGQTLNLPEHCGILDHYYALHLRCPFSVTFLNVRLIPCTSSFLVQSTWCVGGRITAPLVALLSLLRLLCSCCPLLSDRLTFTKGRLEIPSARRPLERQLSSCNSRIGIRAAMLSLDREILLPRI